jgi:hypothetical protein
MRRALAIARAAMRRALAIARAAMRRAPAYLDMIIELRRAMITTKNLEAPDHQPSHQKPMTYT